METEEAITETAEVSAGGTKIGDMVEFANGGGDRVFGVVVDRVGSTTGVRFGSTDDDISWLPTRHPVTLIYR